MTLGLLLSLALSASAAEPPFYMRETSGLRDVGGLNENDRALSDYSRRTDLTNGGSVSGSLTMTGLTVNGQTTLSTTTINDNTTFNSTATFNQAVVTKSSFTLSGTLFGSVNVSSTAEIPANNTAITESALGVAVANSTRTIVTLGSTRHQLIVSAPIRISDAGGTQVNCGFLQNGAFFDSQAATKGVWAANSFNAGTVAMMNMTWNTLSSYAPGTYAYSITCATASGNLMFCQNDNAAADASCFFEVRELK